MVCVRPFDDVLGAFFVAEPATKIFGGRIGPDSRIRKTGFGKRDSVKRNSKKNGIRKNGIRKNGIRKIYVEKSVIHLSVCLAGQGRG
jgi:hypothetical protein